MILFGNWPVQSKHGAAGRETIDLYEILFSDYMIDGLIDPACLSVDYIVY
jgi:hypothetical protein